MSRDLRKKILQLTKPAPPSRYQAVLGRGDGVVVSSGNYVYVTNQANGRTSIVLNRTVPNYWGKRVWVGRREKSGLIEVLGFVNDMGDIGAAADGMTNVPPHNHSVEGTNPDWIEATRILSLLVLPLESLFIKVYPGAITASDGLGWAYVEEQVLDLSSSQPGIGDGARWVLIQADDDGSLSTIDGELAADRDTLTVADIPIPTGKRLCAVILSEDIGTLARNQYRNDFLDLRFDGGSFIEADPVVGSIDGIVKSDGYGNISAAVAGVDYLRPDGDGSGLTNLSTGRYRSLTWEASAGGGWEFLHDPDYPDEPMWDMRDLELE